MMHCNNCLPSDNGHYRLLLPSVITEQAILAIPCWEIGLSNTNPNAYAHILLVLRCNLVVENSLLIEGVPNREKYLSDSVVGI